MKRSCTSVLNAVVRGLIVAAGVAFAGAAFAQGLDERAPERIAQARSWYGTYTYTEMAPRSGGVTGAIDHVLSLSDRGCTLDAQGVMTDKHIACRASMQGPNTLLIQFHTFADGRLVNQYGVAEYHPGQTLIALTRQGKTAYVTRWEAYTRSEGRRESGRFFQKKS